MKRKRHRKTGYTPTKIVSHCRSCNQISRNYLINGNSEITKGRYLAVRIYVRFGSVTQINGHTDITFSYKPIYGDRPGRGRKPVEQVEFEVFYQAKSELEQSTPLLKRLVKQFRLRPDQAAKVLEIHSIEIINRQLYDIQNKVADGRVKNLGSYTAKVFGLEIVNNNK